MYSLQIDIKGILAEGEKFAFENDRELYRPAFEEIEKFVSEKKCIVGGDRAIARLRGQTAITLSSYNVVEIWSGKPFEHAKELAVRIKKVYEGNPFVPAETVNVDTKIKNKLLGVWLDTRFLCSIGLLGFYRGVEMRSVLTTVTSTGLFTDLPIEYMNTDILLCSLSTICYQPLSETWQTMKYSEAVDNIKGLIGIYKLGGRENESGGPKLEPVVKKLIAGLGAIVLDIGRPAIITSVPREQIIVELKRVYATDIEFVDHRLEIPGDYFLSKYSLKTKIKGITRIILDVYNATTYECVPYRWSEGIKVAGDFVNFKYCVIEAITVRMVEKITGGNLTNRYEELISRATEKWVKITMDLLADPFSVFQLDNYDGPFLEANIKNKMITGGQFYPRVFV